MYRHILALGNRVVLAVEEWANRVFTPKYNPFYYLGAITIFLMWLLLISGLYLFIFYKINAKGAYQSVQYLTEDQWYLGGIMRSIHRYASDGMVIVIILHILRVFFTDRYRRYRWIAWVSGVALLILTIIEGITGYWLVWDWQAQIIATLTSEFLDFIPIFGQPLTRAFLTNESVTNLFFLLLIGLHIIIPVLSIFIIIIHVARISRPVINPPKAMAYGIVIAMLALAIAKPATSAPPADLNRLPATLGIDWFYLFFYPVLEAFSPSVSWLIFIGVTLLMVSTPWLIKSERPAKAQVFLENCTGCSQCFKDCPYEAISMRPRTDGRPFDIEAEVIPERCASCGTCFGACDFRAISLGSWTNGKLRDEISRLLKDDFNGAGEPKVLGLVCERSVRLQEIIDPKSKALKGKPNVKVLSLPCIGMVNPSIIEYGIQSGADGVFVCGCQLGDCHYRFGNKWLLARLTGERPPVLKKGVDSSRVRAYWFSSLQTKELINEVRLFQEDLKFGKKYGQEVFNKGIRQRGRVLPAALLLSLPLFLIYFLSDAPYTFHKQRETQLKLSFKYSGKQQQDCNQWEFIKGEALKYRETLKETARVPMKGRKLEACNRERFPVSVKLYVNSTKILDRVYNPTGFKKDGPSYAYEKIKMEPGNHQIEIKMRDSRRTDGFDYVFKERIDFKPGRVVIIDFDRDKRAFFIR